MTHYDYKVVPAPRRVKRVKGVSSPDELFALTLTDAINEVARQGWEYVRAEHMTSEASRGWLRSAVSADQTVLVFRRPRESLGPRLATVRPDAPAAALPPEPEAPRAVPLAEKAAVDRMALRFRRSEPSLGFDGEDDAPPPRLGPADRS